MGTGYTRNDTTNNIADGNVIDAADLDGEFDAIQSAFNASTGHTHDGTSAEGAPITVTGPAQEYVSTGTELRPKTNNTYDLGSAALQWKNAYVAGDITVGGTVDGRDVAADGTKLDGIEAGATADQTAAEIRALVEAATDSNVFTDADHTKLNGIETGATADQTAGEIKTAYESNLDTNAFTDAEKSKLAGIEAGADITDTVNVTAAGALMDSEVTNLAAVKSFDPTDYATAAQGALADSATQPGDNISTLTNDAGYTTNIGDITGVTAGGGITGGGTSGTVTVSHADTSSQASVNNSGNTVIQDVTLDTYGHVTSIGSTTLSIPSAANNATITISAGSQLTGGGAFTTNQSFNETITVNHGNTSGLSGTYGSTANGTKIDTITVDGNGHVTGITTGATGDILGVTAGTGLSGGGTSGTVTLNGRTQSTATWKAGTSTTEGVVSPAKIKAAIGAGTVKAWVNFNGIGTISIRDSGNVSSVTDNGTGRYTINFTTAMPNANYVMAGSHRRVNSSGGGSQPMGVMIQRGTVPSTTSIGVESIMNTNLYDSAYMHIMIIG